VPPALSVCNVGVLWPNGWMNQDATWYGGRPRPRPHYVRWGPGSPHRKRHSRPLPTFAIYGRRLNRCPCLFWPNGWTHQDATWYAGRPRPGDIVLVGDPAPLTERDTAAPTFRPTLLWYDRPSQQLVNLKPGPRPMPRHTSSTL